MASGITVLGGGSWGTALAIHLARVGHVVRLWARDGRLIDVMARERENSTYLPGVRFPDSLQMVGDLASALHEAIAVIVVCPSGGVRGLAEQMRPLLTGAPDIVSAAKGVEQETRKTMTAVLEEVLGRQHGERIGAISGPSFAREVALGMPTAVTAAARKLQVAERVQRLFNGPTFRVYTSTDVVGVEVGGAVKNVIALAAGVSDGLGFGSNSRAALITRGLAEIMRLAVRLGAERDTLAGLSGLGDLVLTCTGDLSRNRSVGLRLGRGERLADIVASMREVAEGIRNTQSVYTLAGEASVEMPITEQMYRLLYEAKEAREAVIDLMSRSLKREKD